LHIRAGMGGSGTLYAALRFAPDFKVAGIW
jgi:hypothetical protein